LEFDKEQVIKPRSSISPYIVVKPRTEDSNFEIVVETSQLELEDPNFIGRDNEIGFIHNLTALGNKCILILSSGGVGKTTLAKNYLNQAFGSYIDLNIAKEKQNIVSVASWVEETLRNLKEEPGREFSISLGRLKRKLQQEKIGVLIDNLEPALDRNGQFLPEHRDYFELLRVLSDRSLRSTTLITSREPLNENLDIQNLILGGLKLNVWQQFFKERGIDTNTPILAEVHKAFDGNALAMKVLCEPIRESYEGNIEAYWKDHKTEGGLMVEMAVENLIREQFDRLRDTCPEAYKLLYRMGCFRYQDVPTIPKEGLFSLLWDVPQEQHVRAVYSIKSRFLIEFDKGEYFLHPVIREEAISRLRASEDWEKSNQQAASYLKDGIKSITAQFEAIEHLFSINDVQGVVSVLFNNILGAEKLDNIRCSANLWNNVLPIIRIGEKAIKPENTLATDDFALVLTVLGILYSEIGANIKAIETAQELLKICEKSDNKSSEKLKFAHLSSYMIQGRAYRLLGNYDKSEIFCQKASKYGQDSKNSIWKGLALYELALAELEKNEPRRALNCIVVAAFMASGILGIPNGLKKLLFEPIESVGKKLSDLITKHEKSDDRTKKFRILYNAAKALNRMAKSNDIPRFLIKLGLQNKIFYDLAKTVLDLAEKYVDEEDKGSPVYLYIEYAEYYRNIEDGSKAEGYYQKTLSLFSTMPTICQAMYKRSYCQFKYELGEDEVTLAECKQAEMLLNETEFYYWTLDNYLMIMELLAKRINDTNAAEAEIANYYRKAQDLCEKIGDPKEFNLNRVNQAFEQGAKQ